MSTYRTLPSLRKASRKHTHRKTPSFTNDRSQRACGFHSQARFSTSPSPLYLRLAARTNGGGDGGVASVPAAEAAPPSPLDL